MEDEASPARDCDAFPPRGGAQQEQGPHARGLYPETCDLKQDKLHMRGPGNDNYYSTLLSNASVNRL